MNDTAPAVVARYRELLLARSGEERMLMGIRMFTVARSIALASFPPHLPLEEVRRLLFARLYGDMAEERVPEQLRSRS